MSDLPATLTARLYQLVDWFIPADISSDREMRKQARMFLISHLFGPFIGNAVPLALYLLDPQRGYQVWVLAASITSFWIYPFVLRAFGRYNLLAIISVQNLNFCILWSCYFYGGVSSPTLPWVLTIPLLAFLYVGSSPSLRLIVLGVIAGNLAIFGLCYGILIPPPPVAMPLEALQGLGIVSIVAASLYVTMMALFYAKALASQAELETEMGMHLATATELRKATAEAERAGAAKADFLARMSHELRTPLNAVIGYSQMLLEDAADAGDTESADDLGKIHGAGQHLLKLINEILDLSKIEAGKMELYVEDVDISQMLTNLVDTFRDAAAKQGNTVSLAFSAPLGRALLDESRTRQAVGQILDNAVKFTANGLVVVQASRARSEGHDELIVSVRDTGVGISHNSLPNLFEQFSVSDDSSGSKYGGTGLGLALSQKLCRLMGGEVLVESELGKGSCFTLHIPVAAVEDEAGSPDHSLPRLERPARDLGSAPEIRVAVNG